MPRKKSVSPIDLILTFAEQASDEAITILVGLLNRELKKRQPAAEPKPVVRRRRKSSTALVGPQPGFTPPAEITAPVTPAPTRRKRRMRAGSQPPVSEATPIVPLQAEVGEDAPQSYEGQ